MQMGYVYILKSLKNNSYYIGSTNNPIRRIEEHNLGKSNYTRNNRPFIQVFLQKFNTLKEARKMEYKLKKFSSRMVIEKIIEDSVIKTKI